MGIMGQHIAIKLTSGGGPRPLEELRRVHETAQSDPENGAWIATRKAGKGFTPVPTSRLLAFARQLPGKVQALTAKIESRSRKMPDDPLAMDMYGEHRGMFEAYWRIRDVVDLGLIEESALPGKMPSGKAVAEAFAGSLSFAYWLPGDESPPRARPKPPRPRLPRIRRQGSPTVPLHGVDFSGARETEGRNGKLWIASWYPEQRCVSLESGGDDPGFGRYGLAERVLRDGGMWVIDFPFGPPARVARAAGWRTWQEYLAWCRSNPEPKTLRDQLRVILEAKSVPWSTKRKIDACTDATWFPFFEQLYRQTITGAREILAPLDAADRRRAVVLPFHGAYVPTAERSVVVEGFPGWTLRGLGLASSGYKHSTDDAWGRRLVALRALRRRGMPIGDAACMRAVQDSEGDALDALVLLYAAWCGHRCGREEWGKATGSAPRELGIEGWYFF